MTQIQTAPKLKGKKISHTRELILYAENKQCRDKTELHKNNSDMN